jgi:autotransporter translocation and assembly factor TamB
MPSSMPPPAKVPRWLRRLVGWPCVALGSLVALSVLAVCVARFAVSPQRYGSLLTAQVNKQVVGTVQVARIFWQLPLHLRAEDISVRAASQPDPAAPADLRLDRLDLHIKPLALLRGTLVIETLHLHEATVNLVQEKKGGPLRLAAALSPRQAPPSEASEPPPGPLPLRIELHHLLLDKIEVQAHTPDVTLSRADISVQDSAVWAEGYEVGITTSMRLAALGRADKQPFALDNLRVTAQEAVYSFAPKEPGLRVRGIEAHAPGLDLDGTGHLRLDNKGLQRAEAKLQLTVQDSFAPLAIALPPKLSKALHGGLKLNLEAAGGPHQQHFVANMRGLNLRINAVSVDTLHAEGELRGQQLTLSDLTVLFGRAAGAPEGAKEAKLALRGSVSLLPSPNTVAGVHALTVQLDNLPLRRLMHPYIKFPKALPESVSLSLDAQGKSLWPLGTAAQLKLVAQGIPAAALPGIPDPFTLSGRVVATPKNIDFNPLRLQGDGAELLLQGTVPLQPDGLIDLFSHVNHVKPGRTLKRLTPGDSKASGGKGPHTRLDAHSLQMHAHITGVLHNPTVVGALAVRDLQMGGEALQVRLPFSLRQGKLTATRAAITTSAGHASVDANCTLYDPQNLRLLTDPAFTAAIHLAHLDLAALSPLLHGAVDGEVRLHGHLDNPVGQATLRVAGLEVAQVPFKAATLTAHAGAHTVTLDQLLLQAAVGGSLRASGEVQLQQRTVDLQVRLTDGDLLGLARALHWPVRLEGTAAAQAHLRGAWEQPVLQAEAHLTQILVDGSSVGQLNAEASGPANALQLKLDLSGRTGLQAQAQARFLAAGAQDTTHLATVAAPYFEAAVRSNLDLAVLAAVLRLPMPLGGQAQLHATAQGPVAAPHVRLTVDGQALRVQQRSLGRGTAHLSVEGDSLQSLIASLQVPDLLEAQALLHLPTATAPLQTSGTLHYTQLQVGLLAAALAGTAMDCVASGTGSFAYSGSLSTATASLQLTELQLTTPDETLRLQHPAGAILRHGSLTVQPTHLQGSHSELRLEGAVHLLPNPLLDLRTSGHLELPLLAHLLPTLGHASGSIDLQLQVHGQAQSPFVVGSVRVARPLSIRPRGTFGEVQIAQAELRLSPDLMNLTHLQGSMGTGVFSAHGTVALQHLQPVAYDLHLVGNDLPVRTPELRLETNVKLTAQSSGPYPKVAGDIAITAGRFTKHFELKDYYFVATQPNAAPPNRNAVDPLSLIPLNIVARTQSSVGVKIDAGAFAVQLDLGANLHITGNAARPRIDGKIAAEDGSLKFPQATLRVSMAALDFVPSPSGKVDAAVRLVAGGDVTPSSSSIDPDPHPYEVTLELDGTLQKMALDMHATPNLSRLQVLALLATGHADLMEITQGGGDTNKMDAAMAFAGSQLSEPLAHFAESQIERALNLKVDLGAEVSDEAVRLTAAKQVHPRLRLEGSYERGLATSGASVGTRARLSLTDRVLLEGGASQDVAGQGAGTSGPQSSVQLRYRLLGH